MEGYTFLVWAIDLLEQIERSPEKHRWCKEYSVYTTPAGLCGLAEELCALIDRFYHSDFLIHNYQGALDLYRLTEKEIEHPDCDRLPYLAILACITWHFRRDHFCEGVLINQSIVDGTLLRLLRRLKELGNWPSVATTAKALYESGCKNVPKDSGIYRVLVPAGLKVRFISNPQNQATSPYSVEELQSKYFSCKDREIVYIGKAKGKCGLRQRLHQYMNCGFGTAKNHAGGRAIWQIENCDLLLVEYMPCEDCEEREHALLSEYREENGCYPLANWRG